MTSDSKPSTSTDNNQSKRRDSLKSRSSSLRSYLDTTERIKKRKRMNWAKGFLKKSGVKKVVSKIIFEKLNQNIHDFNCDFF